MAHTVQLATFLIQSFIPHTMYLCGWLLHREDGTHCAASYIPNTKFYTPYYVSVLMAAPQSRRHTLHSYIHLIQSFTADCMHSTVDFIHRCGVTFRSIPIQAGLNLTSATPRTGNHCSPTLWSLWTQYRYIDYIPICRYIHVGIYIWYMYIDRYIHVGLNTCMADHECTDSF